MPVHEVRRLRLYINLAVLRQLLADAAGRSVTVDVADGHSRSSTPPSLNANHAGRQSPRALASGVLDPVAKAGHGWFSATAKSANRGDSHGRCVRSTIDSTVAHR
jgi:hypothetical protein